jgi:hypothetical protein
MSEKNLYEEEDPMWKIHMLTLMKRKKNMETAQIIDSAIFEYYSEKGMEVPNWKRNKDPQWWTDYLRGLEND